MTRSSTASGTAPRTDVVVIGAGINGLSAAALLAVRGRRVVVLEANDEPGGAVRTAEITRPGFHHDLFAMNLGLFAGGPVMAALGEDLARHGFELVPSPAPFCSVFLDGSMLGVEADSDTTERNVAALSPGDVEAWRALRAKLDEWMPHVGAIMGSDLPSVAAVRAMARAQRQLGTAGVLHIARLALSSNRAFTEEHFTEPRVRAVLAAWGMHLDFPPDLAGGALFSFLETFGGERFGMVIGRGGAGGLIRALVSIIEEHGGQVRCGQEVTEVTTADGCASGVVLSDGSTLEAAAVVANVNPALLPDLLRNAPQTFDQAASARAFRPGLATMMIHLALSDLPHWRAEDARRFNYVHVGGLLDDMALAYTQAAAGQLPERPVLVVGQPTVSDPSRAPEGKHVLWVQVRVLPNQPPGGQTWEQVAPSYADHVLGLLEEYAPGLSDLVLDRSVISPADLERHNRNLIGGDSLGGSHHPAQYFFLRPAPGWTRHRTPIKDLYLCGAGTWPGAGVGGGSGALVADLIAPRRRTVPGMAGAVGGAVSGAVGGVKSRLGHLSR